MRRHGSWLSFGISRSTLEATCIWADGIGGAGRVGIRHPQRPGEMITRVAVSNRAVCTSGGYERPMAGKAGEHHILDPCRGRSPRGVASATVIAPHAMLADALATAAFVLGPEKGLDLLDRVGVEGLIV